MSTVSCLRKCVLKFANLYRPTLENAHYQIQQEINLPDVDDVEI